MLNLITSPVKLRVDLVPVVAELPLPVNLHQRVDALRQHIRNNGDGLALDPEDGDISIEWLFLVLDTLDADGHKPGPVLCELLAQYDMCAEHGCDYDGCRDEGYTHTTEPWHTEDLKYREQAKQHGWYVPAAGTNPGIMEA